MTRDHPITDWDRAYIEDFARELIKLAYPDKPIDQARLDKAIENALGILPDRKDAR